MPNSMFGTKANQVPRNSDLGPLAYLRKEDITPGYLHVRDEKASGTSGGDAVATSWNDRTLNTVVTNTIAGASLSANQVTLPPGTYEFTANAPWYLSNISKLGLYNVSSSSFILLGENGVSGSDHGVSNVSGRVILSQQAVLKLRQYFQNAVTNGLGNAASIAGVPEVYSSLIIRKVI